MKVKKIKIKSRASFANDLQTVARSLDKKQVPKKITGEYFESLDAVRKVLTDKRLVLWRTVRDKKPDSISALAKIVDRGFRAVYRDLLLLEEFGLITFKPGKGIRGDVQSPVSLVDELQVAVA